MEERCTELARSEVELELELKEASKEKTMIKESS